MMPGEARPFAERGIPPRPDRGPHERSSRSLPFVPVAHDQPTRNSMQEAAVGATRCSARSPVGMAWEVGVLTLVDLFPDPNDRAVLELMAEGECAPARYAQALGCVHLDAEAQCRQVEQAKERIRLRLKRYGIRLYA